MTELSEFAARKFVKLNGILIAVTCMSKYDQQPEQDNYLKEAFSSLRCALRLNL